MAVVTFYQSAIYIEEEGVWETELTDDKNIRTLLVGNAHAMRYTTRIWYGNTAAFFKI